ncbi:MAG: hypothetical protein M3Y57_04790 [Acidobacteriota bacterium]|nr:hypothetical protein [Acidobacteriota bacterium]
MATERRPKEASEILAALHSLSLDTEEEILAMSQDEVRARLQADGIDPDIASTETKRRFREIRGRQKLAAAREQRQSHAAFLSQRSPASGRMSFDQIRTEVSRRLNQLSSTKSAPAQVYFNRFQNSSDDDLPGLLDDLRLLEEIDKEEVDKESDPYHG